MMEKMRQYEEDGIRVNKGSYFKEIIHIHFAEE